MATQKCLCAKQSAASGWFPSQRTKKAHCQWHWICSGVKVVCTVAVAVLAAGRTGPAAPGSERADRLHLLHVRCTALPAQRSHAEWCGARFATPPTCAPVSGVNTDDTRLPWSNSAYMCALQ